MEKKKIIIIGSSIVGVIVLILLGIWLISLFKVTYITHEQLESEMKKAAKKYYQDNLEILSNEDGTYSLDYTILSNGGYLKPINEYIKNGNTCTGNVIVIKKGTDYTFIPYLNCGAEYTTIELYKKIIEDNEIVDIGDGLYKDNTTGEYYFKGKIENNYVSLGTKIVRKKETPILWRIISIDNNNIKLKSVNKYSTKSIWDDRYNEEQEKSVGYNDFETSEISDFLKEMEKNEDFISPEYKSLLLTRNLCIGSRNIKDTTKDKSKDCASLSKDSYYYGTITPYEYMRASSDSKCSSADSKSCSNSNYLSNKDQSPEWTTIKDSETDYKVYSFDGQIFTLTKANQTKTFYPVIVLSRYSFYASGTGTETDPYVLKLTN